MSRLELNLPGTEIFRTFDAQGLIRVLDDGQKRYLAFDEYYEQSCVLKSSPAQPQHDYARAMLLGLLFSEPRRVLLLGLGGGGLATALHGAVPGLRLEAVEARPAVIDVAYRYFQLPRGQRLGVVAMDAAEYLLQPAESRVDIVFSDLYGAEGLDQLQLEAWFLDACRERLKPGGWLVLNCWLEHRADNRLLDELRARFADVRACTTHTGNWVLLAGLQRDVSGKTALRRRAQSLAPALGCSLLPWLGRLKVLSAA